MQTCKRQTAMSLQHQSKDDNNHTTKSGSSLDACLMPEATDHAPFSSTPGPRQPRTVETVMAAHLWNMTQATSPIKRWL